MIPQPPNGEGPIDPRGAFSPPPAPPNNVPPPSGTVPPPSGAVPPPSGAVPPPSGTVPPAPPQQHPSQQQQPHWPPAPLGQGMAPPPPGGYPSPFFPPPPPRRGGLLRGIFFSLVLFLFGLSLILNVYLLLSGAVYGSSSSVRTASLLEGESTQKVAVVPIRGMILDDTSARVDRFIRQIEADKNVKAIVIEVDSPGGSVTASDEIFHRLQRYKAKHPGVPVVVSMAGLAASGGYYVACAGDYVFAQPSTLTGNIGVLLPQYNASRLFEKWGIEETTITSSGAAFKNAGSWFQPEKPEDRAYLQDIADKAFAQFKDVVARARQGKLTQPLGEVANGKVFTAADAKTLGLIDEVGYLNDAYEYAAKQAGLNKPQVVRYQDPPTFFTTLMGRSGLAGGPSAQSIQLNGVNVNVGDLHELMTPRLMYLWRGKQQALLEPAQAE